MYRGQGRKQIKPIKRYRKYESLQLMHEIVLYEHSIAYLRTYLFNGKNIFVTSRRISIAHFNFVSSLNTWNMFN